MPTPCQPYPQHDRLIDANGDQCILAPSIVLAGHTFTDVLALPTGFGVAQNGPFITFVDTTDGLTVQAYGNAGVIPYLEGLEGAALTNAYASIYYADGVIDALQASDAATQDALNMAAGFVGNGAIRVTAAAYLQTTDLEAWVNNQQNVVAGIDSYGPYLFIQLIDIAYDNPNSNFIGPAEGMLGWDYTDHILNACFDGESFQAVMPQPPSSGVYYLDCSAGIVAWTAWPIVAPPAHSNSSGTAGQLAVDTAGYLYVCQSTDSWKRVQLNLTSW